MAKGAVRLKQIKLEEQMVYVDDTKLKMSLVAVIDKYSEKVRAFIYACYNDPELMSIYRGIRMSGQLEMGNAKRAAGGGVAYRREIFRFPNGYVFDFVDTILSSLYGPEWLKNDKAIAHELVKPWWVVNKIGRYHI